MNTEATGLKTMIRRRKEQRRELVPVRDYKNQFFVDAAFDNVRATITGIVLLALVAGAWMTLNVKKSLAVDSTRTESARASRRHDLLNEMFEAASPSAKAIAKPKYDAIVADGAVSDQELLEFSNDVRTAGSASTMATEIGQEYESVMAMAILKPALQAQIRESMADGMITHAEWSAIQSTAAALPTPSTEDIKTRLSTLVDPVESKP